MLPWSHAVYIWVLVFEEDKIIIQIEHPGKFTELIPLLEGSNNELIVDENQVKLANMIIDIISASGINAIPFDTDLNEKNCKVVEISASGYLRYEIYFIWTL